jgi:hypothetical protein
MSKCNSNDREYAPVAAGVKLIRVMPGSKRLPVALVVALAATMLMPASAQTVQVEAQPVRVTVADTSTGIYVLTNFVNLDSNVVSAVNLSISGLPAGVGASFGNTVFNNDDGTTLTLSITNLAQGEYTASIDATGGAEAHFPVVLQSGRMWTGDTNVTTPWSSASSWVGGVPPEASDDVLFTQLGAQTNVTGGFTNSIVDTDRTIASLRFSQTNGNARFHTVEIQPGRTLWVTGTNGLRLLRDATGLAGQMDVNFVGAGGTLVVSNASANVVISIDNQQAHRFDLSGLGTFVADVSRVGFGNYRMYPNYTNLTANGFSGNATFLMPRRFIPSIRLARTNIIRATYADSNNYLDPAIRNYSLTFENNEVGTTTDGTLFFGITNAFFLDSLCFVQSSAQAEVANEIIFNPALVRLTNIVAGVTNVITNQCVAVFRGANGGRMSVFAVADAAGIGASGTSTKALLDFRAGTVDALVDRLYMGRDRTNSSDNANGEAVMILAAGTFDVNTAILGFQGNGNNQNVGGATPNGYARGTLSVNSDAVFVVNDTLELGHTTADAGDRRQAELGFGLLNITNGTVMANRITVGGVTKVSANNQIIMVGGNLIVSNTVAAPDKYLTTLQMNSGASLTLHIDGTQTTPYVYATSLNLAAGQTNKLNIASVVNLTIPPEGTNVSLFAFINGGANFSVINMPSPMRGTIVPGAAPNQADLNIITNAPRNLIWRGYVNGNWDAATSNWLDSATTQPVKYINGDNVLFDDLGGVPTTITLATVLIPGTVTVSNAANYFTFMFVSDGSIVGGSLIKNGTGTLEVDAPTSIAMQVNEGSLLGNSSGSVGAANVASGATMTFSGSIGNGVTCAGTATLLGSTAGTLSILSGGIVTNAGTVNGPIVPQSDSLLYNSGDLGTASSYSVVGSPTFPTNSVLINAGNIYVRTLTIGGRFEDKGTGTITIYGDQQTGTRGLTINSGATFVPGGDGIGTTTVNGDTFSPFDFPGRVQFAGGSTNIFKVNLTNSQTSTKVLSRYQDFGASQNSPLQNGCTLLITNIGPVPFAAGQVFQLFGYSGVGGGDFIYPTGAATNAYPIIEPPAPGPGLAWSLDDLRPGGRIGIRNVAIEPTNLVFSPSFTTVTTTNSTNSSIVVDLAWPSDYIGWRLEMQSSTTTNGLRLGASNWTTIVASLSTNRVIITNTISATTNLGTAVFYRMVYP